VLSQMWTPWVRYRVPHKALSRDREAKQVAVLLTTSAD
jgi:hypothetical protein